MAQFVSQLDLPTALDVVFAFLRKPTNRALLAPPELYVEIVAAPPLLELGSRVELKGKRWGMTQRSSLEVTALEMDRLLIEEQRSGPFRLWKQVYRFAALDEKTTRLSDEVTYEPPGGLLGLFATAAFVERELAAFFDYRNRRLLELLGASEPDG